MRMGQAPPRILSASLSTTVEYGLKVQKKHEEHKRVCRVDLVGESCWACYPELRGQRLFCGQPQYDWSMRAVDLLTRGAWSTALLSLSTAFTQNKVKPFWNPTHVSCGQNHCRVGGWDDVKHSMTHSANDVTEDKKGTALPRYKSEDISSQRLLHGLCQIMGFYFDRHFTPCFLGGNYLKLESNAGCSTVVKWLVRQSDSFGVVLQLYICIEMHKKNDKHILPGLVWIRQ